MPFDLPLNHKFACIALENAGVDPALRDPLNLGGDLQIIFEPPFPLGGVWTEWLGSLQIEQLERSNMVLIAHRLSAAPGVLDGENAALRQQVLSLCYAMFLIEVFHYDSGLVFTGADVDGAPNVRQVSRLERFYRPNRVTIARLSHANLMSAARVAAGMQTVHSGTGQSLRLRSGFHAWVRGMMEYQGDERLHQFIRSVEAVVMPPKGNGTAIFAHRCQLFAGTSAPVQPLLKELYKLRNAAEHHNLFTQVLAPYPAAQHERIALERTYQSQALASDVYRRIFLDAALQAHFATDAAICFRLFLTRSGDKTGTIGPAETPGLSGIRFAHRQELGAQLGDYLHE